LQSHHAAGWNVQAVRRVVPGTLTLHGSIAAAGMLEGLPTRRGNGVHALAGA
jgi:hypothetical protein